MRLFPRLLLSHLAVITAMGAVLVLTAELAAHPFIQRHVDEMVRQMGGAGAGMRDDLSHGMRETLTRALLTALPLALLVATATAWIAARRVTDSVRTLQAGSAALASGEYGRRLPEGGQDELAELAHSFNVMAGTLAQVEQGRVELIGNVAHELRAPVSAVRGYVEAAQDGLMDSQDAMSAVHRELGSLERLARDLSLVSRVEAGQVDLRPQVTDARTLLEHAQQRFALPFEERGVTLRIGPLSSISPASPIPASPIPASPIPVWTDPERAAQILGNLLGNALRHTPPGGRVQVGAHARAGQVQITVQDTGSGIAPDHLERVFERFFRADAARTRGEGSGVGLTVARGLARALGGDLTVQSTVGEGSTFSWTLPALPPGKRDPG